jgi:hypothetical protein
MSPRSDVRGVALLSALALGVLADLLIRAPGRPGLNVALWALAGVLVLALLVVRRGRPLALETMGLVGGALGMAALLALRDADSLAVLGLLSAVGLLVLAAGRGTVPWIARARLSEVAFAGMRVALLGIAGPVGWGRGGRVPRSGSGGWARPAGTLARGTLMAIPPLLVLGALLMSADPVFAGMIQSVFRVDMEPLLEHLVFAAVIAWLTSGFLRAFLVPDEDVMVRLRVPQPVIPAAELSVALWILNLLFLGFLAVQLRYLFGGAEMVEVTAGLTYAEYARRGFFELVATVALVVPILLVADWAAAPDSATEPDRSAAPDPAAASAPASVRQRPGARVSLRATSLLLVLLLLGVIASAAYRMWLYQEAYGLTEQRLFVSVFILWLVAVLGWLVLTVLRGRRHRFALGGILAGVACIALLQLLNPNARIARVNLDRAGAGAAFDVGYLRSLSADAVPTILSGLHRLPEGERQSVLCMVHARWSGERPGGWRTWNLGDGRARRLVGALPPPEGCVERG